MIKQFLIWLCKFNPWLIFWVTLCIICIVFLFFYLRHSDDSSILEQVATLTICIIILFFICLFLFISKIKKVKEQSLVLRNNKIVQTISPGNYFLWDPKVKNATIILINSYQENVEMSLSFLSDNFRLVKFQYVVCIEIEKYQQYYNAFFFINRDIEIFVKEILVNFYNSNVKKLRSFDNFYQKKQKERFKTMVKNFLQPYLKNTGLICKEVKLIF